MRIVINPAYQSSREWVSRLPRLFDAEGETIFVKRNVVKRLQTPHGAWIVKRYKRPNLIQRIAYTFWRKSKAERAYLFADRLRQMGIDTPASIAFIECKHRGLFSDSYFVSTECSYPRLFPVLVEQEQYDKPLAQALAAFLVEMHRKGFLHGDLNLDNILYHTDAAGSYRFTVIDTNRSHFRSTPTPVQCLDNLKRVTHRRDLLRYIVGQYARLRGWSPESSVNQVLRSLSQFERRRKLKHWLKGK